jgi:hypothetical protein
MIEVVLLITATFAANPLPNELRTALERQLPAWAQVTSNAAPPSDSFERIVVGPADSVFTVLLIDRKVQLSMRKEASRYWIVQSSWCEEPLWKGLCVEQTSINPTSPSAGSNLYLDSLATQSTGWEEPVPPMDSVHQDWNAGVCRDGLCFAASKQDSSLARVLIRPNGSVVEWGDPFDQQVFGHKARKKILKYLQRVGHSIPFREPSMFSRKQAWYNPSPEASRGISSHPKMAMATPQGSQGKVNWLPADSLDILLAQIERLPPLQGAKLQNGKNLDTLAKRLATSKPTSERALDVEECSGSDRIQREYAGGIQAVWHGKRIAAILLAGASLKLMGLSLGLSPDEVVGKLGAPLGRSMFLLHYKSDLTEPSKSDSFDASWLLIFEFHEGHLLRATLFRPNDDC